MLGEVTADREREREGWQSERIIAAERDIANGDALVCLRVIPPVSMREVRGGGSAGRSTSTAL